ncbi:hypothetical protein B5D77_04545 [Microcystis sp. MC19]|nr:hypothetical protein B5D77_04545 [Microcystis sp. MC19]
MPRNTQTTKRTRYSESWIDGNYFSPHSRKNWIDAENPYVVFTGAKALLGLLVKMYSKIQSCWRGSGRNHRGTKDTKIDHYIQLN